MYQNDGEQNMPKGNEACSSGQNIKTKSSSEKKKKCILLYMEWLYDPDDSQILQNYLESTEVVRSA